jgi:hypothetical protein
MLIGDVPGKADAEILAIRTLPSSSHFDTTLTQHQRRAPAAACGAHETGTPYKFDFAEKGARTYYFEADAKVLDAKQRIARDYGVQSPDLIIILLSEKPLKDTFVLSRLGVGDKIFRVYIHEVDRELALHYVREIV